MNNFERWTALNQRGQAQVAVATLKRLGTFEDGMKPRGLTIGEIYQIADEDWPGPWMFKDYQQRRLSMDDNQSQSKVGGAFAGIALFFGVVIGGAGMSIYRDHAARAEAPAAPLVLGNGGKLAAPGVSAMLGPVTIEQGVGRMPIYVADNDGKDHVLTCLILDEKKRLVAGGAIPVPPKFTGTDLNVTIHREIKAGSVQCSFVK